MNLTLLQRENKQLKEQLIEGVELLSSLSKQVGTVQGEQIAEFTSRVKGHRYNPNDWDMSDKNGDQ